MTYATHRKAVKAGADALYAQHMERLKMKPTYSVSRKADRHAMAAKIAETIRAAGYEAEIEYEKPNGFADRRVDVSVVGMPHGLGLTIHLEPVRGLCAELGGASVLSWHGVKYPWRLDINTFRSVNPCHGQKATDIVDTFDQFKWLLAERLRLIADGTAFIQKDHNHAPS